MIKVLLMWETAMLHKAVVETQADNYSYSIWL